MFDTALFGTTLVALVVILDPPGALPIFLSLTSGYTNEQRIAIARKASITAFGVLLGFALVGQQIIDYLHITVQAMQISGGLLLLLIGLDLVLGKMSGAHVAAEHINIALVPIAVPLYAGPGVLVAILVAMQRAPETSQQLSVLAALTVAVFLVWLSMRYAGAIHRVLGESGTTLVSRIAGLLCTAIAVQMMADGILGFARSI